MPQPSTNPSATTSRAVQLESFGGPEALNLREVPTPQAGPGQIRVRVTAAGLNPMDWFMTADADTAVRFGLSLPAVDRSAPACSHVSLLMKERTETDYAPFTWATVTQADRDPF